MKKVKYIVAAALFLAIFAGNAVIASAQTSSSTQALSAQISALLQQVKSLQSQLSVLDAQRGQIKTQLQQTLQLTRSLSMGMTSGDVKLLQEMLASDPSIYPEGKITGYFGSLTEKAVKKFQAKHGIEQAGNVGPKTLAKLNALLKEGKLRSSDKKMASTTSIENDDDDDDNRAKITLCHKPDKKTSGNSITVGAPALIAHLAHGDKIGACGTTPVTPTTDTTAPIISNLTAVPAATTTVVSLTTNENTTGAIWYASSTPISTSTALKIEDSVLKTSRSFNISGLASSTLYYYIVEVKDAAGNAATSTQSSFTTLAN